MLRRKLGYNNRMKRIRPVVMTLLLSIGFNVLHAFVFTAVPTHAHDSVAEFVLEQNAPAQHDDGLCGIHFEFHQSYVIPDAPSLPTASARACVPENTKQLHFSPHHLFLIKPPIYS